MTPEINEKMEAVLSQVIKKELVEETFLLKLKAIAELMVVETKRVKEGGQPDAKSAKTFARIFDKFSANLLEAGVSVEVCEQYNTIANDIRNTLPK